MMFGTARSVTALIVVCLAGWAGFEIWTTWETNPARIKAPVKSAPVKSIRVRTDGVLERTWVERTLELAKGAGLMELDLYALQAKLVNSGQVHTAVLARKFPDTLMVTLEERSPVARVMAQVGTEPPKAYLVARDGVIFAGEGHAAGLLNTLPYLDGVVLKRSAGKFLPLEGMEKVADLLGTARANVPELYAGWTVVSLARLASDGQIVVRSREVSEIVFGTRESDFYQQIAKLDAIVSMMRIDAGKPARQVNLAVGGMQVPVALGTPDDAAPDARSAVPHPRQLPSTFAPSTPSRSVPQRPVLFSNFHLPSREF